MSVNGKGKAIDVNDHDQAGDSDSEDEYAQLNNLKEVRKKEAERDLKEGVPMA